MRCSPRGRNPCRRTPEARRVRSGRDRARSRLLVEASLDGFIATPDGGLGWLVPFEASPEDYGYQAFFSSVDAVLLGSRTYELALIFGEWPYARKATWVFSHRPLEPAHPSVTVTGHTPREVLAQIEALGVRRVWLVGGGALAGSFQSAGLITEYIVSVIPVILGAGIQLFGASGGEQRLLADRRPARHHHRRARWRDRRVRAACGGLGPIGRLRG